MLREVITDEEIFPFLAFAESRGWEQIRSLPTDLLTMSRRGREMLSIPSFTPREGVRVVYDEAARVVGEWRGHVDIS